MKKFLSLKNLIIFIAVIGLAFLVSQKISAGNNELKYNPKTDTAYTVTKNDLTKTITLAGSIDAQYLANVQFQTSGKLSWLGVKIGDKVKKGQALASLDRQQLQKNLETESNDYLTQYSEFLDTEDEYQETKDRSLLTDEIRRILSRNQYSLNRSVINYELAEIALKYATIYSPIDGIVVASDQKIAGVNITPSTSTITIVNPNSLYFKSEIDEEDVIQISENQKSTIILDSYPETEIDSKINFIGFSPIPGQSSTVYEIRFDLPIDNKNLKYRLGMNGDAQIFIDQKQSVLQLPLDAITEIDGKPHVYRLVDKQLVPTLITTGLENDDQVEIVSGLSEGDVVYAKINR